MTVEVIVPWRPGCPHRERAWAWLSGRWAERHPDWQVTVAPAPEGPWMKALAILGAAEYSTADVLVIADADVWCDEVAGAVDAVAAGAAWAIPHTPVLRLTEEATQVVLDGGWPSHDGLAQAPYTGHAGGGIVVLARSSFLTAPPDPRFVGWGQEDDAWAEALITLVGRPWRGKAPLWHLWHPPQPRLNRRYGSRENLALHRRYIRARRNPDRMAELVVEGRAAWHAPASS